MRRFVTAAGLVASCVLAALSALAPHAAAAYYYCPAGLVDTGTADGLANGSNCSYWLLPSFPSEAGAAAVSGLDVLPVWRRSQGAGVTVALLDTGVDPGQADLAPNLLPGWNVFAGTADTSDGAGHGTLLASVIAAADGNGSYIGIAPQAKLLPVKIMGGAGGDQWSSTAPALGIDYAIAHGARVINCSWGGLNIGAIPGVRAALVAAAKAGVLVVVSAGNDGADLDDTRSNDESPVTQTLGLPNTLAVANFSNTGALAGNSNFGPEHVQVASLGDTLWGDYPESTNGGYVGGTSAAAATVSGVAALLFSAYPHATAAQVRRAIIVGATPVAALAGKVEDGGVVSAAGALRAMATPDTTAPAPFRTLGRNSTFRLTRADEVRFRWSPSSDAELEGYKLTIDGRTTVLPPGSTALAQRLAPGRHRWSVRAYDLSDNETAAHA